jgi:hypothetical protein
MSAFSPAAKLAYLERYHEITQSLIGIARLNMTPEDRAALKVWDDQLDDLQVARWHALGIPYDAMGQNAIFSISDEAVDRTRTVDAPAGRGA